MVEEANLTYQCFGRDLDGTCAVSHAEEVLESCASLSSYDVHGGGGREVARMALSNPHSGGKSSVVSPREACKGCMKEWVMVLWGQIHHLVGALEMAPLNRRHDVAEVLETLLSCRSHHVGEELAMLPSCHRHCVAVVLGKLPAYHSHRDVAALVMPPSYHNPRGVGELAKRPSCHSYHDVVARVK